MYKNPWWYSISSWTLTAKLQVKKGSMLRNVWIMMLKFSGIGNHVFARNWCLIWKTIVIPQHNQCTAPTIHMKANYRKQFFLRKQLKNITSLSYSSRKPKLIREFRDNSLRYFTIFTVNVCNIHKSNQLMLYPPNRVKRNIHTLKFSSYKECNDPFLACPQGKLTHSVKYP